MTRELLVETDVAAGVDAVGELVNLDSTARIVEAQGTDEGRSTLPDAAPS
jgi:hypothetical protein